ncbi:MAG TPA: acyltransferase [Chitinophagaceae bacterium]
MQSTRRYELDWLRVFAFGLLIFYHTGMFFVTWDWHVKNNTSSQFTEVLMLLVNRWRLPLLFLVSGAGVFFAFRKRTMGQFAWERIKRLWIPLTFGMFVIIPPQIYFERLQNGATYSYSEFYPEVFKFQPYPEGSFSWHHLWFVAYLLVFSLICIPLFYYFRSATGKRMLTRLTEFISKGSNIFLILLPALIINLSLGPLFPTTHNLIEDWANFAGSLYVFLLGYLFAFNENLMESCRKHRKLSLILALAFYSLFIYIWKSQVLIPIVDSAGRTYIYILIDTFLGGTALIAVLGYARQHLRFSSPALSYTNNAVYPFYILHQTVIVILGYYLANLNWMIGGKFLLISIATFLICWLFYELLRRTALTRILFGIKKETGPKSIRSIKTGHHVSATESVKMTKV